MSFKMRPVTTPEALKILMDVYAENQNTTAFEMFQKLQEILETEKVEESFLVWKLNSRCVAESRKLITHTRIIQAV